MIPTLRRTVTLETVYWRKIRWLPSASLTPAFIWLQLMAMSKLLMGKLLQILPLTIYIY